MFLPSVCPVCHCSTAACRRMALVGFCTDLPLAEVRLGLLLHTIKSFAIVYKVFFSFTLFILAQTLKRTVRLNYFPYISIQLYCSDFFINCTYFLLLGMDYVRDGNIRGNIQGRSLFFLKSNCPCILPSLT